MVNPNRGQVPLTADDTTYTLSFSINAICALEEALDMPVSQVGATLNDLAGIRMSLIRTVIWAALQDHHDGITVRDAGRIATAAGVPAAMEAVGRAFTLAFPGQDATGNPPEAAQGA